MIKYVLEITVANNELPLDIVEICSNRLMEKSSQIKIEEIDTVGIDCVLSQITI